MAKAGFSKDGNTTVVGKSSGKISKIYISGKYQFANNDFNGALNKMRNINEIKNSDIMTSVLESSFILKNSK